MVGDPSDELLELLTGSADLLSNTSLIVSRLLLSLFQIGSNSIKPSSEVADARSNPLKAGMLKKKSAPRVPALFRNMNFCVCMVLSIARGSSSSLTTQVAASS